MIDNNKGTTPLKWKAKFNTDFSKEQNFLQTILKEYGVKDVNKFLHPNKNDRHDPFLMKNMDKAIEVFHDIVEGIKKPKIAIKCDPDQDGVVSSTLISNFILYLNNKSEIEYIYSFEKEHGLSYKNISEYTNNYFDLILVPDASIEDIDYKQIKKNNPKSKIIIQDHHLVPDRTDEYCITINCHDGFYPNENLCGAGVVMKFCEAYCIKYNIDESILNEWLDLVSMGLICDIIPLDNPETRYYVTEGLKKENLKNDFFNELEKRREEEFAFGRSILNSGWVLGPLVNGVIRYGKKNELINLYRAARGEQEEIEYQPRRKSKNDPKPDKEIHTLQWDMARTAVNVKQRQDNAVRAFMDEIQKKIEKENLDKNSVLFVDCTNIVDKKTVTGLVANKLSSLYMRPVVLMKEKNATEFGGSCRGYDKSPITDTKEFLESIGVQVFGHSNAGGILLNKRDLPEIIKKANEKCPLTSLETIYPVSWEIPANKLKKEYVEEVGRSGSIWGNNIEQPMFAISNLEINAQDIKGYGENNNFIRFEYNGIVFIKKYCKHDEFDLMTCKDRKVFGKNKKNLTLNIIGQFVLNSWEGRIEPIVKIIAFDSRENKEDIINRTVKESVKAVKENEKKNEKENKIDEGKNKKQKSVTIDDDFYF